MGAAGHKHIAFLINIIFLLTNIGVPYPSNAVALAEKSSVQALPLDPAQINIPPEIGKVESAFRGKEDKFIILIQDAHAIPDAQRSIQKLIGHFQNQYGVGLIAVEGAASALDPQIFRSFPDKKVLRGVFEKYHTEGELTGSTAAAIFNGTPAVYQGIEDWDLYEEGLYFYLLAMKNGEDLTQKLGAAEADLEARKQKTYSKALLDLDGVLKSFYEDDTTLVDVLRALSDIRAPEQGSELGVIIEQIRQEGKGSSEIEIEVKRIADEIEKRLKTDEQQGAREKLLLFNKKAQEYRTSQISPQAFVLFLKETIVADQIPLKLSDRLFGMVRNQKTLSQIEGTKLFEDIETYIARVKAGLFENEEQRKLDQETGRLEQVKKFIRLELRVKDWEVIKGGYDGLKEILPVNSLAAHRSFYENAEKRDLIFSSNLAKMMDRQKTGRAILVAGGFHTEGVSRQLKEMGYSYAVVFPQIDSIPQQSLYREQMTGKVSWKDYIKVEDGKIDIYSAFVRATRDRLIKENREKPSESAPKVQPETLNPAAVQLLKSWRDQIIRDLSGAGKIEKAGGYTRFVDESLERDPAGGSFGDDFKKRLSRVDEFIQGLRRLERGNQVTQENVLRLLKTGMIQAVFAQPLRPDAFTLGGRFDYQNGVLVPRPGVSVTAAPVRSEARAPAVSRREMLRDTALGIITLAVTAPVLVQGAPAAGVSVEKVSQDAIRRAKEIEYEIQEQAPDYRRWQGEATFAVVNPFLALLAEFDSTWGKLRQAQNSNGLKLLHRKFLEKLAEMDKTKALTSLPKLLASARFDEAYAENFHRLILADLVNFFASHGLIVHFKNSEVFCLVDTLTVGGKVSTEISYMPHYSLPAEFFSVGKDLSPVLSQDPDIGKEGVKTILAVPVKIQLPGQAAPAAHLGRESGFAYGGVAFVRGDRVDEHFKHDAGQWNEAQKQGSLVLFVNNIPLRNVIQGVRNPKTNVIYRQPISDVQSAASFAYMKLLARYGGDGGKMMGGQIIETAWHEIDHVKRSHGAEKSDRVLLAIAGEDGGRLDPALLAKGILLAEIAARIRALEKAPGQSLIGLLGSLPNFRPGLGDSKDDLYTKADWEIYKAILQIVGKAPAAYGLEVVPTGLTLAIPGGQRVTLNAEAQIVAQFDKLAQNPALASKLANEVSKAINLDARIKELTDRLPDMDPKAGGKRVAQARSRRAFFAMFGLGGVSRSEARAEGVDAGIEQFLAWVDGEDQPWALETVKGVIFLKLNPKLAVSNAIRDAVPDVDAKLTEFNLTNVSALTKLLFAMRELTRSKAEVENAGGGIGEKAILPQRPPEPAFASFLNSLGNVTLQAEISPGEQVNIRRVQFGSSGVNPPSRSEARTSVLSRVADFVKQQGWRTILGLSLLSGPFVGAENLGDKNNFILQHSGSLDETHAFVIHRVDAFDWVETEEDVGRFVTRPENWMSFTPISNHRMSWGANGPFVDDDPEPIFFRIFGEGKYFLIANAAGELRIMETAYPFANVGRVPLEPDAKPADATVQGKTAFVVTVTDSAVPGAQAVQYGLSRFDLTDPASPKKTGQAPLGEEQAAGALGDNLTVIAPAQTIFFTAAGGIALYDQSTLKPVKTLPLEQNSRAQLYAREGDSRLFAAVQAPGQPPEIQIWNANDARTQSAPRPDARIALPAGNPVNDMTLAGEKLLVARGNGYDGALTVVDVKGARVLGEIPLDLSAQQVNEYGGKAIVFTYDASKMQGIFYQVDTSDPSALSISDYWLMTAGRLLASNIIKADPKNNYVVVSLLSDPNVKSRHREDRYYLEIFRNSPNGSFVKTHEVKGFKNPRFSSWVDDTGLSSVMILEQAGPVNNNSFLVFDDKGAEAFRMEQIGGNPIQINHATTYREADYPWLGTVKMHNWSVQKGTDADGKPVWEALLPQQFWFDLPSARSEARGSEEIPAVGIDAMAASIRVANALRNNDIRDLVANRLNEVVADSRYLDSFEQAIHQVLKDLSGDIRFPIAGGERMGILGRVTVNVAKPGLGDVSVLSYFGVEICYRTVDGKTVKVLDIEGAKSIVDRLATYIRNRAQPQEGQVLPEVAQEAVKASQAVVNVLRRQEAKNMLVRELMAIPADADFLRNIQKMLKERLQYQGKNFPILGYDKLGGILYDIMTNVPRDGVNVSVASMFGVELSYQKPDQTIVKTLTESTAAQLIDKLADHIAQRAVMPARSEARQLTDDVIAKQAAILAGEVRVTGRDGRQVRLVSERFVRAQLTAAGYPAADLKTELKDFLTKEGRGEKPEKRAPADWFIAILGAGTPSAELAKTRFAGKTEITLDDAVELFAEHLDNINRAYDRPILLPENKRQILEEIYPVLMLAFSNKPRKISGYPGLFHPLAVALGAVDSLIKGRVIDTQPFLEQRQWAFDQIVAALHHDTLEGVPTFRPLDLRLYVSDRAMRRIQNLTRQKIKLLDIAAAEQIAVPAEAAETVARLQAGVDRRVSRAMYANMRLGPKGIGAIYAEARSNLAEALDTVRRFGTPEARALLKKTTDKLEGPGGFLDEMVYHPELPTEEPAFVALANGFLVEVGGLLGRELKPLPPAQELKQNEEPIAALARGHEHLAGLVRQYPTMEAQLEMLERILHDAEFAKAMAKWLNDAYYIGVGQTPPEFISTTDTPEQIKMKVAINLAGFYALESGIGVLSERSGYTPMEILDAIRTNQLGEKDMLLLARFANATWKASQPFRDLARITKPNFIPAVKLTDEELRKDFVQIVNAATKLGDELRNFVQRQKADDRDKVSAARSEARIAGTNPADRLADVLIDRIRPEVLSRFADMHSAILRAVETGAAQPQFENPGTGILYNMTNMFARNNGIAFEKIPSREYADFIFSVGRALVAKGVRSETRVEDRGQLIEAARKARGMDKFMATEARQALPDSYPVYGGLNGTDYTLLTVPQKPKTQPQSLSGKALDAALARGEIGYRQIGHDGFYFYLPADMDLPDFMRSDLVQKERVAARLRAPNGAVVVLLDEVSTVSFSTQVVAEAYRAGLITAVPRPGGKIVDYSVSDPVAVTALKHLDDLERNEGTTVSLEGQNPAMPIIDMSRLVVTGKAMLKDAASHTFVTRTKAVEQAAAPARAAGVDVEKEASRIADKIIGDPQQIERSRIEAFRLDPGTFINNLGIEVERPTANGWVIIRFRPGRDGIASDGISFQGDYETGVKIKQAAIQKIRDILSAAVQTPRSEAREMKGQEGERQGTRGPLGEVIKSAPRLPSPVSDSPRSEARQIAYSVFDTLTADQPAAPDTVRTLTNQIVASVDRAQIISELERLKAARERARSFGQAEFELEARELAGRLDKIPSGVALGFVVPARASAQEAQNVVNQVSALGFTQVFLEGKDKLGLNALFDKAGIKVNNSGIRQAPVFMSNQNEAGVIVLNRSDLSKVQIPPAFVPIVMTEGDKIDNPFIRDYAVLLQAAVARLVAQHGKTEMLKNPVSLLQQYGLIPPAYQNVVVHSDGSQLFVSAVAVRAFLEWKAAERVRVAA